MPRAEVRGFERLVSDERWQLSQRVVPKAPVRPRMAANADMATGGAGCDRQRTGSAALGDLTAANPVIVVVSQCSLQVAEWDT
ncbi:hypothetical protein GCM10010280_60050 [Streptomyces pilosus]|uniref:Uncharacterized protein n=1 Tax=Streptomyces pilosus TaxID=28893 RepID=A0A918C3J6_9ACTN|nr:hypothetical protein GCM10010280_60050 [Streptomyces pilosus]